jgi:hypothetical protein
MYTNAFSRGCSLIPFQPPVSPSLGGVGSWGAPPNPRHPPMADAPLYSLVNKRLLLTRLSISLFSTTYITQSKPGEIASPSPEGRSNDKGILLGGYPQTPGKGVLLRKDPLHFPVAERPRKLRTSHSQCNVLALHWRFKDGKAEHIYLLC